MYKVLTTIAIPTIIVFILEKWTKNNREHWEMLRVGCHDDKLCWTINCPSGYCDKLQCFEIISKYNIDNAYECKLALSKTNTL